MQASVSISVHDASPQELRPGDIIGRAPRAALRVPHPAVSEAHALVSLRGSTLRLLALRGRFKLAGRVVSDVQLEPRTTITLADGVELHVHRVHLPPAVLAIEVPGLGRVVPPPVGSIFDASPDIVPGFSPAAVAVIWVDDTCLRVFRPREPDAILSPGESFRVGAFEYLVGALPIADAALDATASDPVLTAPLVITVRYDSVHVTRGDETAVLNGIPARILTELGLIGVPVEWRTVAEAVWPGESDASRLRMNWDAGLARIRRSLREFGVRRDLVRTDGTGRAELVLGPRDILRDEA